MNDANRSAEDLFQELQSIDESYRIRGLMAEALSDEEARALVFAREAGAIDNAAYHANNRTDTLNASPHLRRLRGLGLLFMKGGGSRTYYLPGLTFAVLVARSATELVPNDSLGTSSCEFGHQSPVPIPEPIRAKIAQAGVKPRQEEVRQLILALCQWRSLSSREIASALGRQDAKKLVRNHLSPMVAEGSLAYTVPEMENHPGQKYTIPGSPQN